MVLYILVWYFTFEGHEFEGNIGFATSYECEAARDILLSDPVVMGNAVNTLECIRVKG